MTDPSNDFSPESVRSAVATELRYNADDLEVTWDEKETPRTVYEVRGKSNKMCLVVHRSVATAEAECCALLHETLFNGLFLTEQIVTRDVLEAAAKVCNLADLTPYLTMASREGWAMASGEDGSEEPALGNAQTIPEIKANQVGLLATWLKDPLAAVWRLQGGDLPSTLAVLIEQCSFDIEVMTKAIMKSMGGWQTFGICSVTAATPEGYIIEADNEVASDYLEALYSVSGPSSSTT